MKCPYQTKVIHIPEYPDGYAQDVTQFCECVKSECPFYYTSWPAYSTTAATVEEHCRRAEREGSND